MTFIKRKKKIKNQSIFCLIFHCNYPDNNQLWGYSAYQFKAVIKWIGMMWGPDRSLWKNGLSIWFGMVPIACAKQFLIKSQWKSWLDFLEHWVSVCRRSLLTFLRNPWNPLSCNSITILLRGGEVLQLPPDDCRSLYWHMWPSALGWTIRELHLGDKSLLSHLDSHGPQKV